MKTIPGLRTKNGQSKWIASLKGFTIKDHRSKYHQKNFTRAYRSWLVPYLKSRIRSNEFRPILSFLYTDLNCNLNCDYCYSKGKKIPGMSMKTARDSVDWLESVGCKVLAYMGGEPLVRKDFIIELTRYASERGFFVYLPTNGILMDKHFIDEIGKAGVSTINLAVDSINGYNGMPKYFTRIKPQFEYLVEKEKEYGYITFFNINITRNNVKDAKELTKIAHDYGIATDYHICETPLIEYEGYDLGDEPSRFMESDFRAVDELLDWIIEKNIAGYTMVNSLEHLKAMKKFIRHQLQPWPCRAGELSMVIRLDGSFAPCFELYGADDDWGNIYDGPKFDREKLAEIKKKTSTRCLSTCNFQVYHYSQSMIYSLQWVAKHAYARFFGTS